MDNYTDILIRLEKAQRNYPDTHVLLGQTRTAIKSLRATITELQATITELEAEVEKQKAATGYWKNHWEQAYSEQHGSEPTKEKE